MAQNLHHFPPLFGPYLAFIAVYSGEAERVWPMGLWFLFYNKLFIYLFIMTRHV